MKEYLILLLPSLLKVLPDILLAFGIFVAIVCRFQKMGPHTSNVVALQYGVLLGGSVLACAFRFIPELRDWSLTAGLLGVALFLALSAKRWSGPRAPEGTDKPKKNGAPRPVERDALRHVHGGTKAP